MWYLGIASELIRRSTACYTDLVDMCVHACQGQLAAASVLHTDTQKCTEPQNVGVCVMEHRLPCKLSLAFAMINIGIVLFTDFPCKCSIAFALHSVLSVKFSHSATCIGSAVHPRMFSPLSFPVLPPHEMYAKP